MTKDPKKCEHRRWYVVSKEVYFDSPTLRESMVIELCKDCKHIEKVRYQYHSGTGCDNFTILPGQTEQHYTFTYKQAFEALQKHLRTPQNKRIRVGW